MDFPPGQDEVEANDGQGGCIRVAWYWTPGNPPSSGPFTDETAGTAVIIENTMGQCRNMAMTASGPVIIENMAGQSKEIVIAYEGPSSESMSYRITVPPGTTRYTADKLSRLDPPLTDAAQLQSVSVTVVDDV